MRHSLYKMISLVVLIVGLVGCGYDDTDEFADTVCDGGTLCDAQERPVPTPVSGASAFLMDAQPSAPELVPYIAELQTKAHQHGTHIALEGMPVIFGNTKLRGSRVVAYCAQLNSGQRRVTINEAYWNNKTESVKMMILAHEIGHCAPNMNRAHVWNFRPEDMTPRSIMYGFLIRSDVFLAHEPDYWYEYFMAKGPQLNWNTNDVSEPGSDYDYNLEIEANHSHENGTECSLELMQP